MRSWAACAVEAESGDRALAAAALAVRALAAAYSGATVEASQHAARAAEAVDALSDRELARRLDALTHLATADFYLDQFAAAGRHGERALLIGRATGQGDLFPLILPVLGTAHWVQGRMAAAGELLDGAVETARLLDNAQGLVWNLFNRSFAALAAGDVELAFATAQERVDRAAKLEETILTVHSASD